MEPYGNYIINQRSCRVIGMRNGVRVPGAGYTFGFDHFRGLMHHMAPRFSGPGYFQTLIEMDPDARFAPPRTKMEIFRRRFNQHWPGAEIAVDLWLGDCGRYETFILETGGSLVAVPDGRVPWTSGTFDGIRLEARLIQSRDFLPLFILTVGIDFAYNLLVSARFSILASTTLGSVAA